MAFYSAIGIAVGFYVINLLNEHYFGNLSTSINAYGFGSSAPRLTPVSTRAVTGTLTVGF